MEGVQRIKELCRSLIDLIESDEGHQGFKLGVWQVHVYGPTENRTVKAEDPDCLIILHYYQETLTVAAQYKGQKMPFHAVYRGDCQEIESSEGSAWLTDKLHEFIEAYKP